MKKICTLCLSLILLFSIVPILAQGTSEDVSVSGGCNTVDSSVTFLGSQQLIENSVATVLYDATTDSLLYAYNADEQLPPASLVKILTALIAIEKGTMTDVVTVRADVLATIPKDALVVELVPDEVLSVQDLLYCMMVGSGNDASAVLADHVMGSQEAFVDEMNRYARELGCTNTNFTNVHGLHDINQYTSARDVTKILAHAIKNETFREVFGEVYYNVPETNKSYVRYLATENYLLNNDDVVIHHDSRVTGSRTGVANNWTRNIASSAYEDGMTLISVVFGAKSVYQDDGYTVKVFGGYNETKQLLDLGFDGYKTAQILYENQVMLQSKVLNGDSDVFIGTHSSAYSVIPKSMDASGLTYRYVDERNLTAPIQKGEKLSTVQVWCGSVCIAQTDLFALNSVNEKMSADVVDDSQNQGFWVIILYIFGAILGFVLVVFIVLSTVRAFTLAKRKRQSYRNRRNRRRSR